jgi:uncharacterized protein
VRPRIAVLLFVALAAARGLLALAVPPAPDRWFTDRAGVVDSSAAAALDQKLANFEQQSGVQFIIYVFPSIEGDSIEEFTQRAAEQWGVGNKKYNNGLVLFVFLQEKKARVHVGYGLEGTVTDAISSRTIREQIAPHFQTGDYAGGLNAAADTLMARITKGEAPVEPVQPRQGPGGNARAGGIDLGMVIFILFVFFLFILPMMRGRRGGGCGGCWPLFFLGGGGGTTFGGGGWGRGGFGGGGFGGGGGFSGGGGSFGGGGATGGW